MKNFIGLMITPHPPIIIPEIGGGKETEAKDTIEGIRKIAEVVKEKEPELIVCITPHGNVFQDGVCVLDEGTIYGNLGQFGHKELKMKKEVHQEFIDKLIDEFVEHEIPSIFLNNNSAKEYKAKVELDHGCLVPLYFIDKLYKDYKIVHITVGLLSLLELYLIGKIVRRIIDGGSIRAMILASGDLSHCLKEEGPYEFNPAGAVFDKKLLDAITNGEFKDILNIKPELYEAAAECGLKPIAMGLGALDGYKAITTVYSYEGPYGVGYMNAFIESHDEAIGSLLDIYMMQKFENYEGRKRNESIYVSLARAAVEECVRYSKELDWEMYKGLILRGDIVEELDNQRAGAFVSIHKGDELRGCIGTISSTEENLAREIINNAIQAATEDSRFYPVRKSELADLEFKVDILHEIEPIKGEDQLDVKLYGVIVESKGKRGLLLPNLDGVETVADQISIAKQKAGIKPNEEVKLSRFAVTRYY